MSVAAVGVDALLGEETEDLEGEDWLDEAGVGELRADGGEDEGCSAPACVCAIWN